MRAPQIIYIILTVANLMLYARDHGKPKTGTDNFWIAFVMVSLQTLLLWWGGFFN